MSNPTKGRMNRSTYLLGNLLSLVLLAVIMGISLIGAAGELGNGVVSNILALITMIFLMVIFLWVGVFMTIRRLHDMGLSGWWTILFQALGVTVILIFLPGNEGKNKYGPVPKKRFDWNTLLFDKQ